MKHFMASLDISRAVAELSPKLQDAWVNNIYEIAPKLYLLKFRKTGEGTFTVVIEIDKRIHLSSFVRRTPSTPPPRVMTLRSHIRGQPVRKLYQKGFDRIIVFEVGRDPEHPYKLIVEMFGEGNLLLVSPEGKIIQSQIYRKMRDRDLHPGRYYEFPPSSGHSILDYDERRHEELFTSNDKIGRVLAKQLAAGSTAVAEVLEQVGLPKSTKTGTFEDDQKRRLWDAIMDLREKIQSPTTVGYLVQDGEDPIDAVPFPLKLYEEYDVKETASFNEALDQLFTPNEEVLDVEEEKEQSSAEVQKLERRLRDQQEHMAAMKEDELRMQYEAELLYTKFNELNELLQTVVSARQKNVPWEEIQEKLFVAKGSGFPAAVPLVAIYPTVAEILVEIDVTDQIEIPIQDKNTEIEGDTEKEVQSPDQDGPKKELITLDFRMSFTENANARFQKVKKARAKQKGAQRAVDITLGKLKTARDSEETVIAQTQTRVLIKARKKRWYEKFHWFFTSEGHLVLAGTDAQSNQRLVRNYLQETDLFFHASIRGAPSVVMQLEGKEATEQEIKEAAEFAASYSNIWKTRSSAGEVYYVNGDQASLSAPSGEYIPAGGVMIYGQRTFAKNVPVRVALTAQIHESNAQAIAGPWDVIRQMAGFKIVVTQGEISKGKLAKEIQAMLIKKCTDDEEKAKIAAIDHNDFVRVLPGDGKINLQLTDEINERTLT